MLSPAEFVPMAEETGAILDLGELVFRRALTDLAAWRRRWRAARRLSLNVNLSLLQVQQPSLVSTLGRRGALGDADAST